MNKIMRQQKRWKKHALPFKKPVPISTSSSNTTSENTMSISIVLAIILLSVMAMLGVTAIFGQHAIIVFGLLGMYAVYMFFKYVMNG